MPLVISTRALGKTTPLLADFSVPPPASIGEGGEQRLRDLIEHIVRQEVASFTDRLAKRRFDRVLTAKQIQAGAAAGKIDPAGKSDKQRVDVDEAVDAALLAFEDGLYLVLVDEVERRDLEERLYLQPDSRITFIRLAFIAGAW
jgi:hypothetical protein